MYDTRQERMKFYKSKVWERTRRLVMQRDNYECQECARNGRVTTFAHKPDKHKVLEIHHIESLKDNPEKALEMDNLETLCIKCHNKAEGRFQFRPPKPPKTNKWSHDEKW